MFDENTSDWDDDEDLEDASINWLTTDEDEDESDDDIPSFSASAFLRGSFRQNHFFDRKRVAEKDVLLDVLNEVNKTCNMIQVGDENARNETRFKVWFSDGTDYNRFNTDAIYISPNVMRNEHGNIFSHRSTEFFDALDALNGQVLISSYMKRHVTKQEASSLAIHQFPNGQMNIFATDLQMHSMAEISRDWPGFQSYINQAKKRFFKTKKEVLLPVLMEPEQSDVNRFINLLCYNCLNDSKINFHDFFVTEFANSLDECQQILDEGLKNSTVDGNRLDLSKTLFQKIVEKLNLSVVDPKNLSVPPSQYQSKLDDQGTEQAPNVGTGNIPQKNHGDEQEGNGEGQPSDQESTEQKMDFRYADSDLVGDNTFNSNKRIDGNKSASKLIPSSSVATKAQKHVADQIRVLSSELFDGVNYQRTEPLIDQDVADVYRKIVDNNIGLIRSVKNCFNFHNTDYSISSYGLRSGDLDDGSLYKVGFNDYDRLYEQRTMKGRKNWLVSLLLDQSGSMQCQRIREARKLGIVFAESMRYLHDVQFSCYGFTGHQENTVRTIVYKEKNFDRLSSLADASGLMSTPMGYSIGHVSDRMLLQYPECNQKILFVVTDGEPTVQGTHWTDAEDHARQMCNLARKHNIKVFGIGICNAFSDAVGESIFGPNNFVVINDVGSCLSVLTNSLMLFLKQVK